MSQSTAFRFICGTCRWWVTGRKLDGGREYPGTCRRNPPTPTATGTKWPNTDRHEWCGEQSELAVKMNTVPVEAAPPPPLDLGAVSACIVARMEARRIETLETAGGAPATAAASDEAAVPSTGKTDHPPTASAGVPAVAGNGPGLSLVSEPVAKAVRSRRR